MYRTVAAVIVAVILNGDQYTELIPTWLRVQFVAQKPCAWADAKEGEAVMVALGYPSLSSTLLQRLEESPYRSLCRKVKQIFLRYSTTTQQRTI